MNGVRLHGVFAGLVATCFMAGLLSAQTTPVGGSWQMDLARSHVNDGRTVALTFASVASKLKVTSLVHTKGGSDVTTEFVCTTDGKECEFEEGGHKSKVSMWFLDRVLNVCKTEGPPGDVVNEWKAEPSSDGKTLNLTITHLEPEAAAETLVFTKNRS